jgi:Ca2+-binding RTX toxin-like protein
VEEIHNPGGAEVNTTTIQLRRACRASVAVVAGALALATAAPPSHAGPTINVDVAQAYLAYLSCNVNPTIAGTNGADTLQGTAAPDVIRAYGGIDMAQGHQGNDKICGDDGADSGLYGQEGNDIVRGGAGNDHSVSGNEGDDLIFGDAGNDVLGAHPGKDSVYGGADNDTLYGDTWGVDGAPDKDYLDGGPGVDTCYPGWEDTVKNCETVVWGPQPPA